MMLRILGPIPNHILERMNPKDRPKGVAGMTTSECAEVAEARSEKHLQQQLYALLYRRGHRPRMQRMDRKSNIAVGMPDIAFEVYGRSVLWEVKLPGKHPTPDQERCHAELRGEPNNAVVRVIRSYREGLEHLQELYRRVGKELK